MQSALVEEPGRGPVGTSPEVKAKRQECKDCHTEGPQPGTVRKHISFSPLRWLILTVLNLKTVAFSPCPVGWVSSLSLWYLPLSHGTVGINGPQASSPFPLQNTPGHLKLGLCPVTVPSHLGLWYPYPVVCSLACCYLLFWFLLPDRWELIISSSLKRLLHSWVLFLFTVTIWQKEPREERCILT